MSSIFKEINAVKENKMENPGQYVVIPLSTENIISQKSWKLWEKRKKDDPERDNVTQLNLNQPYSALRWQIVGTRSSKNMAGKLQASFILCIHLVSFPALKWRKRGINKTLWHIQEWATYLKETSISKCPLLQMHDLFPPYLALHYSYSICSYIPKILRYLSLNLIPSQFVFPPHLHFILRGGHLKFRKRWVW